MNDMTDAEWMRSLMTTPLNDPKHPLSWAKGCDHLESIATKYEQMARAVMEAFDTYHRFRAYEQQGDHEKAVAVTCAVTVGTATGKHPSDWTREGLMEWLGIAQEESKDATD